MRKFANKYIIGIDHGFGNIKTDNYCFPTGVMVSDTEPTFKQDLLIYEGRYYQIGVGHKEYAAEKIGDEDYYVLTLAAIARELYRERITCADVHIAAGLPLTWVGQQKESFKAYLLQKETVCFQFKGVDYHIRIVGADVFPQGFAAIADRLHDFKGSHMLCDIGNGTMNILRITDTRPDPRNMYTEKFGVNQCVLALRENLLREHNAQLDEPAIHRFLRSGSLDIDPAIEKTMVDAARSYTAEIFRKLRERGYDPRIMRLTVVGGGGCLVRHFGQYDRSRVTIQPDICAAAKGYEHLAALTMGKGDRK